MLEKAGRDVISEHHGDELENRDFSIPLRRCAGERLFPCQDSETRLWGQSCPRFLPLPFLEAYSALSHQADLIPGQWRVEAAIASASF